MMNRRQCNGMAISAAALTAVGFLPNRVRAAMSGAGDGEMGRVGKAVRPFTGDYK